MVERWGSLLFTVKAITVSPSVSAENPWPQLLLKFRGTWKNFSEVLITGILSSLIQVVAGRCTTQSIVRLVSEHFLDMAGNMGNHRILSSLLPGLIRARPALPDSGQELSKRPPETTQLTLKGCNAHRLFSPQAKQFVRVDFFELKCYTPGHLPHGLEDRLPQALALLFFSEFLRPQNDLRLY